MNYKNDAWKSGHHYAEIASNQDGATWYFQEAEENIGIVPLYNIRNQNLGDNNYLNYKDEAWADGKHYAEICPKMQGSSWWLSTSETTEKINTPSGNQKALPLYTLRVKTQGYDKGANDISSPNFLNYKNEAWEDGKHYAEIAPLMQGSYWFFEVDKSSYTLQVSVLDMKLADDQSLDTLLSGTSLGTQTVNNINGNSALTESLDFTKSFTSSSSYTYSVDCEQNIAVKFKMSEGLIFEKAGIDVDIGLKFSEDNSWTKSSSKTTELSLSESVTVDPGKCSKVTGYYKIIKADQVKFTATALVSISGTIIDEQGNTVSGHNVQSTEFIAQYITENVKGMTVVDQNYSDTNVKVEITGHMSANMATMNSYTQEVACDDADIQHDEL